MEQEIVRQGLEIDRPLTIPLRPIMYGAYGHKTIKQSPQLSAGQYRLTAWTVQPGGHDERIYALTISTGGKVVAQFREHVGVNNNGLPVLHRLRRNRDEMCCRHARVV